MPEWLWIIIVGVVVLGLVVLIYNIQDGRIVKIENWKEKLPMLEEILTKSVHAVLCKENTKEIKELVLESEQRIECDIHTAIASLGTLKRLLSQYRGTLMVWIASDLYSIMILYGFCKDFLISLPNYTLAETNLTIEGLV